MALRTLIFFVAPLLVALMVLVARVLSCPSPLNNFAFVGNGTHTSAQLIDAALDSEGGIGRTEVVSDFLNNPVKVWPKDSGAYTSTIPYCYANGNAKLKLSNWILGALSLWINKIGNPGYENNHGL